MLFRYQLILQLALGLCCCAVQLTIPGWFTKAARARAGKQSCWSAATRNIAPRRRCRNWPRSWPSVTASNAPCCLPSIRRTARSTRIERQHPRTRSARDRRPDDHRHAVPQPARRQMKQMVDYVESGSRSSACARRRTPSTCKAARLTPSTSWNSKEWDGGFGRQVLGETWINHHGDHGKQSTRGIICAGAKDHPILRGIKDGDIWGPTDVYGVRLPLPAMPAARARPGARRHEARRQAGRGQEERPDDAGRLGQDVCYAADATARPAGYSRRRWERRKI